jgi:hypothetical protein
MTSELNLRRKWTFRTAGKQVVFVKKAVESDTHVFMKAFIWALYLPYYPDIAVEISIGKRYKPDLVQLDKNGKPVFWGEAGRVSRQKIEDLVRRFRHTHLVFAKWDADLTPFKKIIARAAGAVQRSAPVDLIAFPSDSARRFIDDRGIIQLGFEDVNRLRWASRSS